MDWRKMSDLVLKRLQSIPELAHIHVFAKKKSDMEMARWDEFHRD